MNLPPTSIIYNQSVSTASAPVLSEEEPGLTGCTVHARNKAMVIDIIVEMTA